MWHFRIRFSRKGGVGWMVGLDDLEGLFQPMILWFRSNPSSVQHPRAEPQAELYRQAGSISQGHLLHWGPRSTACFRWWKDGDLVQTYLDSQTHWSPYLHESGSKWTLNVSLMCEEGGNSRSLCSSEVQLFILSGHSHELQCNLMRHQQYSMRGRDNTANGLEHQVQFHRTLGRTCSAYFELVTSTEAMKSLQVSLLFMFSYRPCKHLWPQKSKAP